MRYFEFSFKSNMSQESTYSAVIFYIIVACLAWTQADIVVLPDVLYYNLTTTSRVENYIQQHQRQYVASDRTLEMHLSEFRQHYLDRIELIDSHLELVQMKLNEVENKLHPLMLLDDVNAHCVQKYRIKLPKLDPIKTSLAACKQKSASQTDTLVSPAFQTRNNLKNYQSNQFVNILKDCKKKFSDLEANYTSCATTAVKSNNLYITSVINTFHNQLKNAKCTANIRLKESFDCYAGVVFDTYSSVGEVMGLVENCMAGHEFCPSCGGADVLSSGRCPYHLSWHLSDNDMTSEKINNPFKGISKATPCLQVNFITKGVALE